MKIDLGNILFQFVKMNLAILSGLGFFVGSKIYGYAFGMLFLSALCIENVTIEKGGNRK